MKYCLSSGGSGGSGGMGGSSAAYGGHDGSVNNYGGSGDSYDRNLEKEVRRIVADMGGVSPCDNAWAMTFGANETYFREDVKRFPGASYSMSAPPSDIEKINMAYRLAAAGWRK